MSSRSSHSYHVAALGFEPAWGWGWWRTGRVSPGARPLGGGQRGAGSHGHPGLPTLGWGWAVVLSAGGVGGGRARSPAVGAESGPPAPGLGPGGDGACAGSCLPGDRAAPGSWLPALGPGATLGRRGRPGSGPGREAPFPLGKVSPARPGRPLWWVGRLPAAEGGEPPVPPCQTRRRPGPSSMLSGLGAPGKPRLTGQGPG